MVIEQHRCVMGCYLCRLGGRTAKAEQPHGVTQRRRCGACAVRAVDRGLNTVLIAVGSQRSMSANVNAVASGASTACWINRGQCRGVVFLHLGEPDRGQMHAVRMVPDAGRVGGAGLRPAIQQSRQRARRRTDPSRPRPLRPHPGSSGVTSAKTRRGQPADNRPGTGLQESPATFCHTNSLPHEPNFRRSMAHEHIAGDSPASS